MNNNNEDWYVGPLGREEAEDRLKAEGFDEGLFLVRDSASAAGDFVLSVVHDSQVIHYQIRRRAADEDAFFSLSEESKVIHGLDELVRYYRDRPDSGGLQHRLMKWVKGGTNPPPETRLHGTENLLHRATVVGDVTVVSELLKCGYRNLTAKNHDGQTAVHLASFYGRNEVLRELIAFGAGINVADLSGYSPLHFACQADRPETIEILLTVGKANPTFRNQITGWVPLHEAAWKGHRDCCRVLLEAGRAPLLPRTPKNETPGDLARANGHHDLAQLLEDHYSACSPPNSSFSEWYHPTIDRSQALKLMKKHSKNEDGTFLIRNSNKRKNTFVLSLCFEGRQFHFEIVKQGIYYFLDQGPYMMSLEHLVDHYSRFPDGLPVELRIPVPSSSMPNPPPRVPFRAKNQVYPTDLKPVDNRKPYENNETLRRVRHSRDNIPLASIRMTRVIGEGEFGSVYEGEYMGESGEVKPVAVKVLNEIGTTQTADFLREASVMMKLDHQCVVKLIGVSSGPPVLMVLELVPLGSLLEYLIDHRSIIKQEMEIALWAAQIACGMMYLESRRFIHRDLAARNILLASKFQAKISDFGLSRMVAQEKDYYRASQGGRWPIKWYAPECINFGTFSHASDVWSFGVLLWEMFTYGETPYDGMNGAETLKFLEDGGRLRRPDDISEPNYEIMSRCWEHGPEKRPTFKELFVFFSDNPEYLNIRELLLTQDFQQLGL